MGEPILVVSGFGRCGSSMVMQMLSAGGMECAGKHPMYEIEEPTRAKDFDWLGGYGGKALKWLDPTHFPPPSGYRFNVLWLTRDAKQQAKSIVKWRATKGQPISKRVRNNVMGDLKRDTQAAVRVWQGLAEQINVIAFERILLDPVSAAAVIRDLAGVDLDIHKMAAVVRPRGAQCLEGFLEAELKGSGDDG